MKCLICGITFSEDAPETAMPFCSQRCKLIDAGRWLDEKYGLPIENEESSQQQDLSEDHFPNKR
jgi:endogenous inhibitor of DNA gyrase (YacG/DUF329 family)